MQNIWIYYIKVEGRVDEKELNIMTPVKLTVVRVGTDSTLITTRTDQSGLIGVLRHLHGRGFFLLSVTCEP